ncbi:40S ribosomal protein S30 [Ophidiomyces ophidiicola]|nr:40S ribosomal protein S30 [Ophidiomyces ophidiicola]KAI1983133.1 40S ribosomal protein S30 [Ophidiomyces ophidiicola]KAI1983526.1 40S ribosomal protein S30 [Ophidiomyces ophidiicola]KAI1994573.1 40S ribosomal protein S30 [Ophidiomyces ophidiicola]KAI2084011.1 40S ribosomal protein S30 [Ophidiomyces ophidiicola]
MGKVHGSLARAGKVKSQTPKVEPQEKKKTPKGRAKKRLQYTRRFVNVTMTGGKRKVRTKLDLTKKKSNMSNTAIDIFADEPQPNIINATLRSIRFFLEFSSMWFCYFDLLGISTHARRYADPRSDMEWESSLPW